MRPNAVPNFRRGVARIRICPHRRISAVARSRSDVVVRSVLRAWLGTAPARMARPVADVVVRDRARSIAPAEVVQRAVHHRRAVPVTTPRPDGAKEWNSDVHRIGQTPPGQPDGPHAPVCARPPTPLTVAMGSTNTVYGPCCWI